MIIDKNSDSSVDLVDWLRRSSDESEALLRANGLDSARIKDVYLGQTLDRFITYVEYLEDANALIFTYNTDEKLVVELPSNGGTGGGGSSDIDLSEYAKLSDLESEVSELESKIPTSTSDLTNDSNFVNQTQVDDRIKEVVGAAPEALDTLQEISKALGNDPDFAASITNQISEVKKSIPSIEGLATEKFVRDQINAIPKADLTGYAKEEWVKSQGYLTEHQDISHLATKAELEDVKASIPSIEGLATESYVGQAKSDIEKWVAEQGYLTEHQDISHLATKEEIPSLDGYATEKYVDDKIASIEHPSVDLSNLATKDELSAVEDKIPSIEGLATQSWVEQKIAEAELSGTDIDVNLLATKSELAAIEAKIPNIEGLATEDYVAEQIAKIEHPTVDLTDYAKTSEVTEAVSKSEANVKTWVENQKYIKEHQDISHLATKDEVASTYALKSEIPSIEGLATEDFVNEKIDSIQHPTVDLTGYAKEDWVENKGYLTDKDITNLATMQYVENKADEVEAKIPNLDPYATRAWVEETIAGMESGDVDHSIYALKSDLDGLASESFVKSEIAGIEIPEVDLTGYAKEEWVKSQGYLTEHQDISDVVKYNKTSDERKAITLDNHDLILGRTTKGDTSPLVMMSKWDVADFGSKEVHANINTLSTTDIATDSEGKNIYVDGLNIFNNKLEHVDHVPVVTVNDDFALATLNHVMAIREADAKTNADTYVAKTELEGLATKDELNSKIAALNTKFQWKDNVVTYSDIVKLYPNPEEGFSVYVDDEQTTYIYMGGEWVAAATSDGDEIPAATEELDGLMPAEAMRKLNSLKNYDDSAIQGDMTSLEAKMAILEAKLSEMNKTNIQAVSASGAVLTLADSTKDYAIQGEVTAKLTVAGSKSVTISDAKISNDARTSIKSTGEVELKNIVTEGTFAKANGNTVVNISDASSVVIKDMDVNSTQYNTIEIGLSSSILPKSVIIEDCNFTGSTNNAISIHGTQDNAIINISNCTFKSASNQLRLSNRTNAKNVVINITNCKCEEWSVDGKWSGFLLMQDFTSKSVEESASSNLFSSDKITINFINFIMPNGEKLTKPEDLSTLCGSGSSQIMYVYRDADHKADKAYECTPYGDGTVYPMINII